MMGALIKTHFATLQGLAPNQIYSVAAMPCVAKKFEAQRPEMSIRGQLEVDLVLSTRELAKLIKLYGIDINNIEPQLPDSPLSVRSTSGKLFANSGGTAEGVIRTLFNQITGKEITTTKINDIRTVNGTKEFTQKIGKEILKVIVVNGISDIHSLMSSIASGETKAHYIEVMTCPGGCINGGGQPMSESKDVKARSKTIYEIDETESLKCAHNNPMIKELYSNFLESPGSEKAKKILHVSYTKRDVLL
jgi:iron only hydrogenase large subunit-like protein